MRIKTGTERLPWLALKNAANNIEEFPEATAAVRLRTTRQENYPSQTKETCGTAGEVKARS